MEHAGLSHPVPAILTLPKARETGAETVAHHDIFFILTNTRAYGAEKAAALTQQIAAARRGNHLRLSVNPGEPVNCDTRFYRQGRDYFLDVARKGLHLTEGGSRTN